MAIRKSPLPSAPRSSRENDQRHFNDQGFEVIDDSVTDIGAVDVDISLDINDIIVSRYAPSEVAFANFAGYNSLLITSACDLADGVADNGVRIENNCDGDHCLVEFVEATEGLANSAALAPTAL